MATLTTPPVEETDHALAAANEPSMEDILASIRRIIAEDQTNGLGRTGLGSLGRTGRPTDAAPNPAAPSYEHPTGMAHPLVTEPENPDDGHVKPEMSSEILESHRPDEPALVDAAAAALDAEPHLAPLRETFVTTHRAAPQLEAERQPEEQPLISSTAGASITSSFHALAESMLLQDKALVERLTRDELRPLLKTWLDDNLPSIVERLVRNEIERVARGGRGRD